MAEKERELKDVYIVYIKEFTPGRLRLPVEKHVFESAAGAIRKYEDLILEYEGKQADKRLLVELQLITQGQYFTLKEKHLWNE
jgi:hypothetical protein